MLSAKRSARVNVALISPSSFAPTAWAVKPVVPMRKKPNAQNTNVKISDESATEPIRLGSGIRPMIAVSTTPINGVDMLEIITGTAMENMER